MEIKDFAKQVHANAVAHGWWDGGQRNFGELIALCHSELSEALEEYRNGHEPTETYYSCHVPEEETEKIMHGKKSGVDGCPSVETGCNNQCAGHYGKIEGVPSELADVIIRVLDMCEHYGIDIEAALAEKHAYNKTRPFRHGGKRA